MKNGILIVFIIISFLLRGCVTLYKPNAIYSPQLKEKGELNVASSMGVTGCGSFNLQAAYSVTDHVGLMIDGMYHYNRSEDNDSSYRKLNAYFGEFGAGYYTIFGTKVNLLFQCYSGGGYGVTLNKDYNTNGTRPELNAKYFNLFFQPGLAYSNEYLQASFDLRANYIRIFDVYAYQSGEFEWLNPVSEIQSDTTFDFLILEPTVTAKFGKGNLKCVVQAGLTAPTINSESYYDANSSSLLLVPLIKISVGFCYTFGNLP